MNKTVKEFLEELFGLALTGIVVLGILFAIGMFIIFISNGGSCSRSSDHSDYPYRR